MPEPTTKICESCDAEIGASETKCPKCGIIFEELEEAVSAVERAQSVLEKRRAKKEAESKCPKCKKDKHEGACAPIKKPSALRALGSALRGKK